VRQQKLDHILMTAHFGDARFPRAVPHEQCCSDPLPPRGGSAARQLRPYDSHLALHSPIYIMVLVRSIMSTFRWRARKFAMMQI
jgi:hypothetical protein